MPQFKKVYLGNVPKKHANTRMGKHFFLKMGQSRPLFVDFRPFLIIQIEKNVDFLGFEPGAADETTELWRPPRGKTLLKISLTTWTIPKDVQICTKSAAKKSTTI